ncbi:hypothetical protein BT96DRAFT_1009206 [Gymnopus androsaceus JB14]|uniref:F-box domain-containing protein n=1 Tax=Gymnopus androsaceus JB14 TaxID=1447944 RepID=A0A6A4GDA4_9AGAR|nr:hypothetical protein BT96DRAFT_1009206 [Gymnopus androsaceus JB14]
MTERRVPNELIDCVLENLYSDRATLLNCALVGRAWVRASQRGIFRKIVLELPESTAYDEVWAMRVATYQETTAHLGCLFAAKPYLASSVQSLELWRFGESSGQPEVWYTAAASVLQRLSNVNNLSFCEIRWNALPPFLRSALTELFTKSLIRVSFLGPFRIETFAELASLLSRAAHLKILDAAVFSWEWDVRDIPTYSDSESNLEGTNHPLPRSIPLEQLKLHLDIDPFMTWFQQDGCPFQVDTLQLLSVNLVFLLSPIFTDLLRVAGRNLRVLELTDMKVSGPFASLSLRSKFDSLF